MFLIYANPPDRINSISDRKFRGVPEKKQVLNITAVSQADLHTLIISFIKSRYFNNILNRYNYQPGLKGEL
jgi:hypothetical protein